MFILGVILIINNDNFNKQLFIKNFDLELKSILTELDLNKIRIKYLGRKGLIIHLINQIKFLNLIDRKNVGLEVNYVKNYVLKSIKKKKSELESIDANNYNLSHKIDISLPGRKKHIGSLHPITNTIYYIEYLFQRLGFNILKEKFEIEHQYYNFDALNIPDYHPARHLQDTFWFDSDRLLRTQTSNMQIHEIKKKKLPIKIIAHGKVYRRDYDQTHVPMFHQIEGLVIDKGINFSNLIWIINKFLSSFFKKNIRIRFRNSYFPFTVLSSEVDIMYDNKNWLEILGCGIVHPNILKKFDIDSKIYSGLAFGIGVERIIMLYYGIKDIRLLFKNDVKFLRQFNRSRYY